ncbi:hypothetical protein B5G00_08595 [Blautia sp. An46]|nr:hypothetical protein B5G00_08595 [Blautia sp. An46]
MQYPFFCKTREFLNISAVEERSRKFYLNCSCFFLFSRLCPGCARDKDLLVHPKLAFRNVYCL